MGCPLRKAIARVMAERLGWDLKRQSDEINALQNQQAWELAATK